ncbi:unnamed protein product [Microthlaspi erraticum]|uniref:FKB95-like N-terminal Kelch domain-containing protein n=1 Tax=Microthlaspi erraticum TaxID=1685480 RepID=A0A6D2KHS6_9BRAS|nr:unnamed protein product [Microthlaspi erraticum]
MSLRIFSLEEDFFELRGLSLEEDFLERRGADGGGLSSFLGGGDRCGEVDLRGETDLCGEKDGFLVGKACPYLQRKPDKTLTNNTKSAGYVLARAPVPDYPPYDEFERHLSVGSCIYRLSRWGPSSHVPIMDCRSHTWAEAPKPSFPADVRISSGSVFDHKIYVLARYKDGYIGMNYFAVFDTETQSWDPLLLPCTGKHVSLRDCKSVCIDGKFYLTATGSDVVVYDPKEGRWDLITSGMDRFMFGDSYCVIGNVLYSASAEKLQWYDGEVHEWRDLQGLVGLPKIRIDRHVTLADYGGKMVVLWKNETTCDDEMSQIWCAEIALERSEKGCEILGRVEWFDVVLTSHEECRFFKGCCCYCLMNASLARVA